MHKRLDNIIKNLRIKVEKFFGKDKSGHSIDHLERTLKYATFLQSKEGGDLLVISISAFIHDIHRIMSDELNRYVSPEESLPVVEEFIADIKITEDQKNHILHAIKHHEEYNFSSGKKVTDIESKILQDADNLDAIGAIGLVRVLKYGINYNLLEYDPKTPLYNNDFVEGVRDASTIHHIYNKLMRLGDNMNTKTAKKISKNKTKLLKDFVDMYVQEFNGVHE